ncbi:MAG: hypothetical protein ABIJ45_14940 [Candidatus Zixiibacteriota bacterium]
MNRYNEFASKIDYELKRAERYRIFLSLVVFNVGPVVDLAGNEINKNIDDRKRLISGLVSVIKGSSREIDHISNSGKVKIGILMPETSRQGAEVAARRISDALQNYCRNYFEKANELSVPIEISSFPDATDSRSISSYIDDFAN